MSSENNCDIVTQIQDHLNALLSSFYNFAGALQRDAPPASVKGEEVVRNANQSDVQEQMDFMAKHLVKQSKLLEELIGKLPDLRESELQQLEAIASAQATNDDMGNSLGEDLQLAQKEQFRAQDLFGILADNRLLAPDSQFSQEPSNGTRSS